MRFYFQIWARNNNFSGKKKKKKAKTKQKPKPRQALCVSKLNWNCYSAICNTYCHIKVISFYFCSLPLLLVTKQQILGTEGGFFGRGVNLSCKVCDPGKGGNFATLWDLGVSRSFPASLVTKALQPLLLCTEILFINMQELPLSPFLFGKISKLKKLLLHHPISDPCGWSPGGFVPLLEW